MLATRSQKVATLIQCTEKKGRKIEIRNAQFAKAQCNKCSSYYAVLLVCTNLFTYEVRGGRISIDDQVALEKM